MKLDKMLWNKTKYFKSKWDELKVKKDEIRGKEMKLDEVWWNRIKYYNSKWDELRMEWDEIGGKELKLGETWWNKTKQIMTWTQWKWDEMRWNEVKWLETGRNVCLWHHKKNLFFLLQRLINRQCFMKIDPKWPPAQNETDFILFSQPFQLGI